jgi:hypothetical protein
MASSKVKVDFNEIKRVAEALKSANTRLFITKITDEIALRLLRKAIKRTPVEEGTLRRNWNIASVEEAGNGYEVTVFNPMEYASYVEFGHRQEPGRYVPAIGKRLKKSWVQGQFFLTKSEIELERELPKIIEKKLEIWLKEVMGSGK